VLRTTEASGGVVVGVCGPVHVPGSTAMGRMPQTRVLPPTCFDVALTRTPATAGNARAVAGRCATTRLPYRQPGRLSAAGFSITRKRFARLDGGITSSVQEHQAGRLALSPARNRFGCLSPLCRLQHRHRCPDGNGTDTEGGPRRRLRSRDDTIPPPIRPKCSRWTASTWPRRGRRPYPEQSAQTIIRRGRTTAPGPRP